MIIGSFETPDPMYGDIESLIETATALTVAGGGYQGKNTGVSAKQYSITLRLCNDVLDVYNHLLLNIGKVVTISYSGSVLDVVIIEVSRSAPIRGFSDLKIGYSYAA